jgi:hypothetical protein
LKNGELPVCDNAGVAGGLGEHLIPLLDVAAHNEPLIVFKFRLLASGSLAKKGPTTAWGGCRKAGLYSLHARIQPGVPLYRGSRH